MSAEDCSTAVRHEMDTLRVLRKDMCAGMCVVMCVVAGVCSGICASMCIDKGADMRIDVCIHAGRIVHKHGCVVVWKQSYPDVCRHP